MKTKKKHWYDYLWIWSIVYFALGFFNILFAWLGMIDFLLPIILAVFGGNKFFCNHLCGRRQLYCKLGGDFKCSRNKPTPKWITSKWFRYGFLIFFLTMFGNMVFQTFLVASGAENLREAIKLFWTFRIPWGWTYSGSLFPDWVAQLSFGFYSLMLTSLLNSKINRPFYLYSKYGRKTNIFLILNFIYKDQFLVQACSLPGIMHIYYSIDNFPCQPSHCGCEIFEKSLHSIFHADFYFS